MYGHETADHLWCQKYDTDDSTIPLILPRCWRTVELVPISMVVADRRYDSENIIHD